MRILQLEINRSKFHLTERKNTVRLISVHYVTNRSFTELNCDEFTTRSVNLDLAWDNGVFLKKRDFWDRDSQKIAQ